MINKDKQDLIKLKKQKFAYLKKLEYQSDPLLWLSERLGENPNSFEWSLFGDAYLSHVWDGDINPLSSAWYSIANKKWVSIEAGTGTSKTYMLARIVMWWLDCYKGGTCVFIANTEKQLKLNIWKEIGKLYPKFKKLHPQSELQSLNLIMDNTKGKDSVSYGWEARGIVSGVGAEEQSATSIQGIHNENLLIIIEEAAGAHYATMQALKQTCVADNNIIIAVGNPDNSSDELHKFSQLDRVDNYRVSAYDYPNVVLDRLVFAGAVTRKSIEHRKNELGELSDLFKSRVRGISPSQSKDSLILTEWFDQCIDFTPEKESFNSVGVDVARSDAGDKAAVSYIENSILVYIKDFQCPNASYLAYNLLYDDAQLMQKGVLNYEIPTIRAYKIQHEQIAIDGVGIGVSTVETFNNLNINVTSLTGGQWKEAIPTDSNGLPYYKFVSLRAQMYWELREDLRNKRIGINIQDKNILQRLRKELSAHRLVPSPSGIKVNDKEDVKKILGHSPNLADSYVYSNFVRKGYRLQAEIPFMNIMGE